MSEIATPLGQRGFTLIEVMLVVAIVAVLATIAVPSFVSVINNTRMSGEINSVVRALNFARSEATKRGQLVSVCPSSGTSCASASDWTSGWQVLLNSTQTQQLLVPPGVSHGDTLSSTLTTYPQFTPAGYTFYSGTLSLHDSKNTPSLYRCIVFNAGSWVTRTGASCP